MSELEKLEPALRDKIQVRADGCWIWTGSRFPRGYGKADVYDCSGTRTTRMAHREVWERLRGPLPPGRAVLLDHRCRSRACVNPEHVDPVTPRENLLRSPRTGAARNAAKTHCIRGHELAGLNLMTGSKGERLCRECRNESQRKHFRAKRLTAKLARMAAEPAPVSI